MSVQMSAQISNLRTAMRDFIDNEVIPHEHEIDKWDAHGLDVLEALKAEAKRRDLWALGHPAEIGGGGLPFMEFALLNEIIGRSEFGQLAVGSMSMQDSIMLHLYASPEQRERFLKPLVAGEIYPSVGLTEPEVAGSDPTLMQTRAELDGDQWVINGHKWFTSNGSRAAFVTVFAQTDPDAASPYARFSAILVPTDTPGYEIVRAVPTMGHVGGDHCEVRYNDVRVLRENLLGQRGGGFVIAQKRANERYAHGSLLREKGEIQRYIAESAAEIQAARLMTLDAARVMDSGDEARIEISLIKFWGAQMLHNVIDRAIQVHGALGVTADTPLERMYREARYARLYDGPDEVHRMVVARRLLDGAPPPWA